MSTKILMSLALLVALAELVACDLPAQSVSPPVDAACTSFCLDNGGHTVFGSNYDNQIWEGLLFVNKRGVTKTGWETGVTGKYARWTARYGSVTFSLAGVQMAWAGMNEAGLAVSTMWLGETRNPRPDERPPLISPLWVQYQLDTCATIEEVMANDARVRIADTVDHYLVCDRSGACAAVEFLESKTIFHTGDAMPVKALTNYAYLKAVDAWQRGRLQGNSLQRFGIAADRVTDFQPGDTLQAVAYAFETLDQASGQATGGTPTQWSIVFDTDNLRIHFHTSRNPQVRTVDLTRLDFDCGTPVEMLDVHAPFSDDITDKFDGYSFDANLQTTLNFLEKWGSDISPQEVEVLERGFEAFGCKHSVIPYQEEREQLLPPTVSWATLFLLRRFWPLGIVLLPSITILVVWRVRVRARTSRASGKRRGGS